MVVKGKGRCLLGPTMLGNLRQWYKSDGIAEAWLLLLLPSADERLAESTAAVAVASQRFSPLSLYTFPGGAGGRPGVTYGRVSYCFKLRSATRSTFTRNSLDLTVVVVVVSYCVLALLLFAPTAWSVSQHLPAHSQGTSSAMPAFNPFTPCANTVRRMSQIFRRDAHLRSASGASTASSSASSPSTPTTPTYNANPFFFSGPSTEMRAPSPTFALSAPASPASPFFSDPAPMDARMPYRRRSRPQMTSGATGTAALSGVASPAMTTSVSYSTVGQSAKRNSVSSSHSYRSSTSLGGGMAFPGLEDEIREPATERLRRRLTRMARKMKRKMNAAGRKLRRNSEASTRDASTPQFATTRSASEPHRRPVSYPQYATAADLTPCMTSGDCRAQTNVVNDPWMDLEWQF
ncbi:hypothetical protein THASP1DRAFT_23475 [Thamnocephalis sphaerospora]|uniref:Uncharacterized protein n=1 Tax=Thamnocephalis sphaerospora TaxID=78915 RepID=A0A4P9XRI0_9FUNG|nr:hypothetical protein THASP1DRAFT_23475 [Thamnocephalis sphaerospora]|eukprot:RKP08552.1 hypothetical protein THASP1DRAFT_23475 [Thamnocephalis sphaerospora]